MYSLKLTLPVLTNKRVYFQRAKLNRVGQSQSNVVLGLQDIKRVSKRRYLLQPRGVEIETNDGTIYLFALHYKYQDMRDQLISHFPTTTAHTSLASALLQWQRREISNFEYLSLLNKHAHRSTHDLTQYPVFPWVLQDYHSSTLNLQDPHSFRDLSKPIGALNPKRLASFKARYASMKDMPEMTPFLYGTHYSTPGYVLFYLLRQRPGEMLRLQNGKFDASDRLFKSVQECWHSVLENAADLKELIPEFYQGDGKL